MEKNAPADPSRDLVAVIDRNYTYLFANPAFLTYQRLTSQQVIGHTVAEVLGPEVFERAIKPHVDRCLEGFEVRFEMDREYPDFGLRHLEVSYSPLMNEHGETSSVIALIHDITARRRQEEILRESQQRWQFALDGAGDGVWDWNPQTGEVYFSPQWKAMLGYSENEIFPTLAEWENRVHPDDRDAVLEAVNRHLSGQTPVYQSEHRLLCKDNTYKWILDRGKVVQRTADGLPLRVIGTHSDISAQRSLLAAREEAASLVEQQKKALEEINANKDRFFSIIAHDLRGPVTSFISLGSLLSHLDSLDKQTSARMIQEFRETSNRLLELLDHLLTWARVQRGAIRFDPIPVYLAAAAQRSLGLLEPVAKTKQVSLVNFIPDQDLVQADSYMLDQILFNLINNAIKFSQPGGRVWVESRRTTPDWIEISVSDTGIGMDPGILDDLFNIGVKTSRPGTAGEKGTGLGLILCKEFVERHHGSLRIESQTDRGTTVSFSLPIHQPGCDANDPQNSN